MAYNNQQTNPHGQNPYGQMPYGQQPYGQAPYGQPRPGGPSPGHNATPRHGIIGRTANAVIGMTAEAVASRKDNKAAPTTYNERLTAPPSYDQNSSRGSTPNRSRSSSASKQKSRDTSEKSKAVDDESDSSVSDIDDEELDLDEAAEEVRNAEGTRRPPPSGNMASPAAIKTLVTSYVEQFPPPRRPIGVLQRPVILPQRRPGNKERGFVHAYAPMLQDVGISQEAFLSFFEYFAEAIKVGQDP